MAKNKRTPWTQQQVEDFVAWHDARLKELNYPPELIKELTDARERWLPVPAAEQHLHYR